MNLNRKGRAALVLALVAVVGMAFRVSWNALRDIAGAVGADATAATLYPFVVDGLMALALVATLVLVDQDRTFALRVLGTYTLASLVLNYVHGLVPELHGRTVDFGRLADWDPANWALVLLATSLPVGSIYFGSDLVAKVLHHRSTPAPAPVVASIPASVTNAEESAEIMRKRSMADLLESTPAPIIEPVTASVVRLPDPVDFLKSTPGLKPMPSIDPVPVLPVVSRAVAAAAPRARRATGRVPDLARTGRPRRTQAQLLDEARTVTAAWSTSALTAEAIRRELRTSPANARVLRDTLRAERAA
ncbi:DUF2637 domain-containing protein [Streptomyces turgidiscabies]|uniref:DUF2637 domain-containing protein n=1 Tax=Streptomyces turgidiscabies (strain Car8) TaxID=698760 RepID=L7FJL7_STRT8|nr:MULTISPECIES: DUF2637 domain-containing protein [Streptomyces]ELP70900.1 hypothetical protein STRTUCAR8_07880 [Streptomyces turgidiscabies Car8]MDX3496914.1 DUF2637 domain-containing protein [Streptomyces turgidiscabies]GAQ73981.1 hypothetical protein T45_05747 [Streptomyces turgidiscabies]